MQSAAAHKLGAAWGAGTIDVQVDEKQAAALVKVLGKFCGADKKEWPKWLIGLQNQANRPKEEKSSPKGADDQKGMGTAAGAPGSGDDSKGTAAGAPGSGDEQAGAAAGSGSGQGQAERQWSIGDIVHLRIKKRKGDAHTYTGEQAQVVATHFTRDIKVQVLSGPGKDTQIKVPRNMVDLVLASVVPIEPVFSVQAPPQSAACAAEEPGAASAAASSADTKQAAVDLFGAQAVDVENL